MENVDIGSDGTCTQAPTKVGETHANPKTLSNHSGMYRLLKRFDVVGAEYVYYLSGAANSPVVLIMARLPSGYSSNISTRVIPPQIIVPVPPGHDGALQQMFRFERKLRRDAESSVWTRFVLNSC